MLSRFDTSGLRETARRWGARGTAAATFAARVGFEGVGKDYNGTEAVREFTFTVEPGEAVCLLGPSGCGKSTLLRLAAGLEKPTRGRITLDGREVAGPSRFVPPEKRSVGLMFQDFALFPHLSIGENVAFGLTGLSRAEAQAEAAKALARVGLERYAGEYPHILSGGQQQRVALARAIVPRPGVILMDEPFSGLDPRLREVMREETLTILRETRSTAMIVTHDAEEAMRMGDRIVVMRDGRLIQAGRAEVLYHAPADLFVARMFSALNEIDGVARNGRIETLFGTFAAPGVGDGEPAVLCIRQSSIKLMPLCECAAGLPGRIIDRKFLGDTALVAIAVDGIDAHLLARVREPDAPRVGDDYAIDVDHGGVLVFPLN